jgi:hypothetical protein
LDGTLEEAFPMENSKFYKKIVALDNALEAQLVGKLLTERGIPHRIRSYYDSAYDGLYQAQKGWGRVEAPEEYEAEIKAICSALPGEIIPEEDPSPQED